MFTKGFKKIAAATPKQYAAAMIKSTGKGDVENRVLKKISDKAKTRLTRPLRGKEKSNQKVRTAALGLYDKSSGLTKKLLKR